ncbi:hypothetical protein B296_00049834 [Ensete ventricosum]|uniref:Uncharacterized protein n=1 Tax=Ensete ventricosum TaxID=4639 RepID=A0A426XT47_ENSVE|nr:hypothetical protein B296_00049834 [Ensete ventricosum]
MDTTQERSSRNKRSCRMESFTQQKRVKVSLLGRPTLGALRRETAARRMDRMVNRERYSLTALGRYKWNRVPDGVNRAAVVCLRIVGAQYESHNKARPSVMRDTSFQSSIGTVGFEVIPRVTWFGSLGNYCQICALKLRHVDQIVALVKPDLEARLQSG